MPGNLLISAVSFINGMGDAARLRFLAAAGQIRSGSRMVVAAVPVTAVHPNPDQPRRYFDADALQELAASIRSRGLLQPIVVARQGDGYLLMAGERRWRAARLAGLESVPAVVRNDDPLEVALIENLQRADLTPLEEAEGLGRLIDQFGYTHEALAEMLGKSRPYVSNTLALRRLPEEIKAEYHAAPDVSREILIRIAREESPERQAMLWRLTRVRRLSVQKFRNVAGDATAAGDNLRDVIRLVRRLGRKLRTVDASALSAADRRHLERVLARARNHLHQMLAVLAPGG